jgi:PilZ domain
MRVETSDLSLGGCYIGTSDTIPVGTRLSVGLSLGEEKVMISAIVVACYPQVGNGIQFLAMPPADRNRVRTFLESLRDSH